MGRLTDRITKVEQKIFWNTRRLVWKNESTTILKESEEDGWIKCTNSPALIEPQWGYIFSKNGTLLEDSLEPNFDHPKPNWRIAMPSYMRAVRAIKGKEKVVNYPTAISLRHFWEWNYYHFYLDVLGKLALLKDIELLSNIPIILGRYALELPFVYEIINTGYLKGLNWVIQDNFYVEAERVIYLKTHQSYKKRIDLIMDLMGVPEHLSGWNERTFLTRLGNVSRKITNHDEVAKYLNDQGFAIVDTKDMTIKQQIDIFSKTGVLVGIHGAGMTNIIFRRNNCLRVLELHPESYREKVHEIIGREFDYSWDTLAGIPVSKDFQHTNFYIPIDDLATKLDLLLNFAG